MAIITGTTGNDTLNGTTADDQISGLDGNDTLNGSSGNDLLDGGAGDDFLTGGAGADQLIGGAGTDMAIYAAQVTINLKTGIHTGEATGDTFDSIEIFAGSTANDTFVGNGTTVTFNGGSGIDTVDYSASASAVNVTLGAAGVTTSGSGGDAQGNSYINIEQVIGSAFNDTLTSTATIGQTLTGGAGNDIYIIASQNVTISESAGGGDDEIRTNASAYDMASYANVERLTYTGTGGTALYGNASDNIITGGVGNDTLAGADGSDQLLGGDGNDTLYGGNGADQVIGGAGTDTAAFSAQVTINLKTGVHTGEAAGDIFNSIEAFAGSSANDTFVGNGTTVTFNGGAGTDTVDYSASAAAVNVTLGAAGVTTSGSGGDAQGNSYINIERVVGSAFNDTLASTATFGQTLVGGDGNDTYIVDSQNVTISESAGGGDDEIRTHASAYDMASYANVERLTYTGTGGTALYGNASDNIITGGVGNDTLAGADGSDQLLGGDGNDTLYGGNGADQVIGGAGTDTAAFSAQVTINLKTGVHTGEAAGDIFNSIEAFAGSSANDTFVGNGTTVTFNGGAGTDTVDYSASAAAVNVTLGAAGVTTSGSGGDAQGNSYINIERVVGSAFNDTLASTATFGQTLVGGVGNDTYIIDSQNITVTEAAGEGDDEIRTGASSFDMTSYANIERLTYAGTGATTLIGNASDNIITGGVGNDTLAGADGSDQLLGGDGNDTLYGGNGADQVIGGAGTDTAAFAAQVTINLKTGVHTGEAAGDTFNSIEAFAGSSANDTFVGNGTTVTFNGGAGTDTVDYSASASAVNITLGAAGVTTSGSGGDAQGNSLVNIEQVIGSAFNDTLGSTATTSQTLVGGAGNDTYIVTSQNIIVTEAAVGGDDEIRTTASAYTMASYANIERLTFTGTGPATLVGNASDNVITGGAGDDTLYGGAGADQVVGGAGTDTAAFLAQVTINLKTGVHTGEAAGDTFNSIEAFSGSAANDTFVGNGTTITFNGGAGTDTVDYSASAAAVNVTLGAANVTTTGSGGDAQGASYINIEQVIGSAFNDTLGSTATVGHTLAGGAGNDIYVVGTSNIVISEAAGAGDDEIRTTATAYSMANYANVERLTFTGTGNANLTGNAGNNVITGGSGNDFLSGGAGADQLIGGAGTDTAYYASQVTINLKTGVHTGEAAGDTFNSIEAFSGSAANDTFVGNGTTVTFNGDAGTDTVDYSGSAAAVNVTLGAANVTTTGSGGDAQGASYINIEQVIGSAFNDTLGSTATVGHTLAGGAGNDIYVVGTSNIVISEAAGAGDDEIRTTATAYSMANYTNVERLTFTGTGAADLTGNAGDNVITGGVGNDFLNGGAGADQLIGGAGTDMAYYTGQVTINLKTGVHTGEAAGDTFDSIEIFAGSSLNDTFVGNGTTITFNGGAGTDTVDYSASAAAVNVTLGAANVTTTGSGGDAQGASYINIEQVIGSAFNDTLGSTATVGHTLAGGAGNDIYVVGTSNIVISEAAGAGDDEIRTTATAYSMANYTNVERLTFTGTGNVTLTGNAGDNIITGGTGNDTLIGGAGADRLVGGAGTDIASYTNATAAVTINVKTGVHTGEAAGDTFDSIEQIAGSSFNDTFFASSSADNFDGYEGTLDTIDYSLSSAAVNVDLTTRMVSGGDAQGDVLINFERVVGSSFADTLASSTSGHTLVGGVGDDVYVVGNQAVTITEATGEGNDEIRTTLATYSMAAYANVERLTFTGTGNATLTGNSGDNVITGGAGNDTLTGGAGADQLIGGAGTDTASYVSSAAAITFNLKTGVHSGDAAGDTFDSIETILGTNFNDTFYASASADNLNGGAGTLDTIDYSLSSAAVNVNLTTGAGSGGDAAGDVLTSFERVAGTSFADTLGSSTSGHALAGGAGDDIYIVGSQGVTITEVAGEGRDEIRTSLSAYSMANYANVEDLTFTGTGNAVLTGNAGDNVITGGTGNDQLNGGDGSDQLNGGSGDDTLSGGAGSDHLFGGAGFDTASYSDSGMAMTFNLATGVFSGVGAGDTFDSIENILGTNFGDTFIASALVDRLNGGAGVDLISYSAATSAIGINLTTGAHTGFAAGDIFDNVEIIQGSNFADTIVGNSSNNTFLGSAGADSFDGAGGYDGIWYLSSTSGVTIDLSTGTASGGDAAGDAFTNIETVIGSNYADTLTAASTGSILEGAGGSDTINGGIGADILYGGLVTDTGAAGQMTVGYQADTIRGGGGNDRIYSAGNSDAQFNHGDGIDAGSYVYGDAGADTIVVSSAIAYGGSENDTITVWGTGFAYGEAGNDTLNGEDMYFSLYGGDGSDRLNMKLGKGFADGGNDGDIYHTDTILQSTIHDTGTGGTDYVYLDRVANLADLVAGRVGNDLVLGSQEDKDGGITYQNSLVILENWYSGGDTIEIFVLADGTAISGGAIG